MPVQYCVNQRKHSMLIDVTRLVGRLMRGRLPTGVDRVGLEYVRHFAGSAHAVVRLRSQHLVLSKTASLQLFASLLNPSANFAWKAGWLVGRQCFRMPSNEFWKNAFFFNTGHSGLEREDYSRALQRHGVKPLFFVHDLIPISHPEYCRAGERDKHVRRMHTVLHFGRGVIANSQATLDALKQHAAKIGMPMPPAVVAPLAPTVFPAPSDERPITAPYFITLGTIEPRKNHLLLLQVWKRLVERLGANAPKLVIIGQRGWDYENVASMLDRCEILRGSVIERNGCGDQELSTFLHHAQALLFPTFAEGYGMPLAEALSLGVPVVASNLPVFREIAGDVPDYVDPLDALRWQKRVLEYAEPHNCRRPAQMARMQHFRPSSWGQHLNIVESFLECLSGQA
jgi:glycosyltransferase involved in cell wall biosynthesis